MAKTIAQLRTEAQTIRDAVAIGENTATRVGGTIEDVVDYMDEVGGTFASGEEVGDVSIFDDQSDLTGKTDAQKALMIPNGLAYSQGGGNTNDIEHSVVTAVKSNKSETPINGYIRASDCWVSTNSTWKLWKITNSGYKRLKAHVRDNDANAFAVSFFNSSTINAANKLAGYAFSGNGFDDFDIEIPIGTQLICVCTRASYIDDSYFYIYTLEPYSVQTISDRLANVESGKAIEPFALMYFVGGWGWSNTPAWSAYGNLIGDPYKHELAPYLIDGKLIIINNYTGTNQVKCKIPWFNALGGGNSYNAWTVLQQGENVFTPRANSVYFSICLGMNDSGGTEINASDVSLYEGFLFYKLANTNPQQITANIGSIQSIENRLDVMDNFGNPLYVDGQPINYDKAYFGRPLIFPKRYSLQRTSIATGGNQGGAIYGDLLFAFNNNHKNCFVIDMPSKGIIQNITLTQETNFHCNCATFGVEKADAADEFPLLYVDALNMPKCYVYRITGTRGAYVLTKVQTITYPSAWNHPEMVIDTDENALWVLEETSSIKAHRMAIPTLSQGDITLDSANVLETIDIITTPSIQGASIYNGDLYLGTGLTGGGKVFVVDLYTEKRIMTYINFGREPQTPFVWNGRLYVLESGTLDTIFST